MKLFTTITGLESFNKLAEDSKKLPTETLCRLRAVMEKMVYDACNCMGYPDDSFVWNHAITYRVIEWFTNVSSDQALVSLKIPVSRVTLLSNEELLNELSDLLNTNEERFLCRQLLTYLTTYTAEEIKQFVDKIIINNDYSEARNWLKFMQSHNSDSVTNILNKYFDTAIVKMKTFLELTCEILKDKGVFAIPDKVVKGKNLLFALEHRCI